MIVLSQPALRYLQRVEGESPLSLPKASSEIGGCAARGSPSVLGDVGVDMGFIIQRHSVKYGASHSNEILTQALSSP